MIKFQNSIAIQSSVERVFGFVARAENLPLWNYYINSVARMTPGSDLLGARYHQIRKTDEQIFEVTRFEDGKLIELTTIRKSAMHVKRLMIFSVIDDVTHLDDFFELDNGYPSLLQRLFTGKIKRAVKENLEILKILLETGQAILQDGRVTKI